MDADPGGHPGIRQIERLGLLGGTFDPVHVGHLVAAQEALVSLRLDRVLIVVAGDPWQKAGGVHAPADVRLAMVEAAVEGVAGLEASGIEVDRPGPSYTADTLAQLASPGREIFVIVGSDVAAHLDTWVRVDEVRELATLVIVQRAGEAAARVDLGGWRVERVTMPRLDLSATEIRRRVEQGLPIDFVVPSGAVRIIRDRGLYTRPDDACS